MNRCKWCSLGVCMMLIHQHPDDYGNYQPPTEPETDDNEENQALQALAEIANELGLNFSHKAPDIAKAVKDRLESLQAEVARLTEGLNDAKRLTFNNSKDKLFIAIFNTCQQALKPNGEQS